MDLALNGNHDIYLDGNDLALTTTDTETIQDLGIRLRFFMGEWFIDVTAGVPYFQEVLKKGVNIKAISSLFKKEIMDSETVSEILEFELSYDDRTLRLDFKVMSDSGVQEFNEEITV